MKMRGAKQVHYDSGPNMTPLVDVVMVILIFLMLAGSFSGATQFLVSKQGLHKQGSGGKPVDPSKPMDTPIEIHIDNAAGGFAARGTGITATNSPEKLKDELIAKRQSFNSAGTSTDQLEIVLYPGRNVKYRYLIQVYDAALRADFTKVAFAVSH